MTPGVIFLIVLRTALIVIGYGAPALRIRGAIKLATNGSPLARRLLREYLMLLGVGLIDVVSLATIFVILDVVPETGGDRGLFDLLILVLWFGSALPYIFAGRQLGRVLEPNGSGE